MVLHMQPRSGREVCECGEGHSGEARSQNGRWVKVKGRAHQGPALSPMFSVVWTMMFVNEI